MSIANTVDRNISIEKKNVKILGKKMLMQTKKKNISYYIKTFIIYPKIFLPSAGLLREAAEV